MGGGGSDNISCDFQGGSLVVMDGTLGSFFKPEKNLESFRLKMIPEMPILVSLRD